MTLEPMLYSDLMYACNKLSLLISNNIKTIIYNN